MEDRAATNPRVTDSGGILEGMIEPRSGVRSFEGIPFAAPPVGDLRWRPPQPARDLQKQLPPWFARNSNTAGEISSEAASEYRPVFNRSFHVAAHPSRLVLPIIER